MKKKILSFLLIGFLVLGLTGCGNNEVSGIDFFVARKVLRKFEALNLSFLHPELESLIDFLNKQYGKDQCPECIEYIKELIKNS